MHVRKALPRKNTNTDDQMLYSMDDFLSSIVNHRYPVEILSKLAEALGKSQYAIFGQSFNDTPSAYKHTLTEKQPPFAVTQS